MSGGVTNVSRRPGEWEGGRVYRLVSAYPFVAAS